MKLFVIRGRQIVLFAGDVACCAAGLLAALAIRYPLPLERGLVTLHATPFAIVSGVWLFTAYVAGLYSLRLAQNRRTFFELFFAIFSVNVALAALLFYFLPFFAITPKTVLFLDLGFVLVFTILWRVFFNRFMARPSFSVAVLGEGKEVDELLADFTKHPQQGVTCAMQIKNANEVNLSELLDRLVRADADALIVAPDYRNSPLAQKILLECAKKRIIFLNFVTFYEDHFQKIPLATIDSAWMLEHMNEASKRLFAPMKRALDLVIAFTCGVIGIVLAPFIALAVWLDSRGPILYSQMRVGYLEKPFRIYKFRTMRKNDDEHTITRVGRFLRASHLDEIPQLWNVFKGDMSFVGPRPEQVSLVEKIRREIPLYTERLLVRPGITGWAQLHEPRARAEDAMSKLQYDLFYVKNRSLLLDLEVIWKTVRILLS